MPATKKTAKKKRAVATPPDLTAALAKSSKAQAAFEKLAPSHRREYLNWIAEAKRSETRARRIEKTVLMLAAGKKRDGH